MKWLKDKIRITSDSDRNKTVKARLQDRISHINRKMSRGASNIYKMMKTHCKWGNKQLWGFKEKTKRHFDHFVPKQRPSSKKFLFFRKRDKKKDVS